MKNYLNSAFYESKELFYYYKELRIYKKKQYKFRFINFICLIKYIIFEEVSYLIKLRPRIMNQLEAERLKEEAQKYIGREIDYYSDDKLFTLPVKYKLDSVRIICVGEKSLKIAAVNAILKNVSSPKQQIFRPVEFIIDLFKEIDSKMN